MAKTWWADETPPFYYSFAEGTGEYIDAGLCDPSPLEPGIWLVPGHATRVAPPATNEGFVAVRGAAREWQVKEDHRGEVVWLDGSFRKITSIGSLQELGIPPLQLKDAEFFLPDGSTDPNGAMIRLWVNDDVLTFADDMSVFARQVLEVSGLPIRPIAEPVIEPFDFEDAPFSVDDDGVRRLDALAADLDKLAQSGVEGIQIPQRGDA